MVRPSCAIPREGRGTGSAKAMLRPIAARLTRRSPATTVHWRRIPVRSGRTCTKGTRSATTDGTRRPIRCYDEAIAVDACYSDGILWGQKGCALQDLGRLNEAIACFEEVLRISPSDAMACLNIGVARHSQGRLDDAIHWYRAALERDPNYRRARSYLEMTLNERERSPDGSSER